MVNEMKSHEKIEFLENDISSPPHDDQDLTLNDHFLENKTTSQFVVTLEAWDDDILIDDILLPINRWKAFIKILCLISQLRVFIENDHPNNQKIRIDVQEGQDPIELMTDLRKTLTVLLPQTIFLQYDISTNQIIISQ